MVQELRSRLRVGRKCLDLKVEAQDETFHDSRRHRGGPAGPHWQAGAPQAERLDEPPIWPIWADPGPIWPLLDASLKISGHQARDSRISDMRAFKPKVLPRANRDFLTYIVPVLGVGLDILVVGRPPKEGVKNASNLGRKMLSNLRKNKSFLIDLN